VAPESSALDTVFKICVSRDLIGAGHGTQPTFQALASMASGSMPKYLSPPVCFPSISDLSDGEEEEEEVE
jgi:hypothetical protein